MEVKEPTSDPFDIDPIAEKKLLRKLDLRIVPGVWLLYMLAFLDRTNIGPFTIPTTSIALADGPGNAKIQGMTEDLNMTGQDYSM